jgi:hypothetical protein
MLRVSVALLAATLITHAASAQVKCGADLPAIDRDATSRMTAQDFVNDVAPKEAGFAKALANYAYTIEATVQTVTGDAVDGEFRYVAVQSFDDKGPRREVSAVANSLKRIKFAERDLEALRDAFTLVPERISTGDIVFSGRQKVEDHNAALFDVLPRNPTAEIRGFEGRTWVWPREDAIMRLCGRSSGTPIAPLRFEVVRTLVDGQHWFPLSISADEEAPVGDEKVRVRVTITYSNYKAR